MSETKKKSSYISGKESRRISRFNRRVTKKLEQARADADQAGGAQSQAEALRGREAMAVAAAADQRAEAADIKAEN